ncbi:peptidoglycan binding protein CsiV [Photobacterium nomapromontoriensis]|uniref:peptidoglycan binding protein CsiV n=1 Tax=Photobacterium nomapromontoriensis TaxID=2910237 RepID=UPI003D14587F
MKKLIYLLLIAVSWPSLAARQFDIEVLLFKRNIAPEQVNESWPDQLTPIDLTGTIDFGDTAQLKARGIRPMSPSQFQLNPQYDKLKQHAGFTPLAHFGWRQGDLSRAAAPTIHITAGKDFSAQYLPDGTSRSSMPLAGTETHTDTGMTITTDNPSANDTNTGAVTDTGAISPSSPLYELDGTMKVYVQHYLFTDATFDLREPDRREIIVGAEPIDTGINPLVTESNVQVGHLQEVKKKVDVEEFLKSYRFNQQRKMRSSETHYLDHPLMGMVIQIRRIGG